MVLKHTVPGAEDSLVILSHDVNAHDAQQTGEAWGPPGALQVAQLEQRHGARGSFLVTTDEVAGYYVPALMQQLCGLGMCPCGAHSTVHGTNFGKLPVGNCYEHPASYRPQTEPTLCGEVRVSVALLEQATGHRPVAWRSPFLLVHPSQYDVLAEMSAGNAAAFTSLWTYAMLRNADNNAAAVSPFLAQELAGVRRDDFAGLVKAKDQSDLETGPGRDRGNEKKNR